MVSLARLKPGSRMPPATGEPTNTPGDHHPPCDRVAITPEAAGEDFFTPVLRRLAAARRPPRTRRPRRSQPLLRPSTRPVPQPIFPPGGRPEPLPAQRGHLFCRRPPRPGRLGCHREGERLGRLIQGAFRADPRSFLIEAIESAGGTGDIMCAWRRHGRRLRRSRPGRARWSGQALVQNPVSRMVPGRRRRRRDVTIRVPGSEHPIFVKPAGVSAEGRSNGEAAGRAEVDFEGRT